MKKFLSNLIKGIFIGLAFVIPGLSGATVALILSVYEKLISELAKINFSILKNICLLNFNTNSNQLKYSFLIPISIGGIIGVLLFSKILDEFHLLTTYKPYTLSYFFGLVLGSVFYIINLLSEKKNIHFVFFLFGLISAISLSFITYNEIVNTNYTYLFICGFIAVLGMIIPGLSGSHLLWILGIYPFIIEIINNFLFSTEHFFYLLIFFFGLGFGIISVSRLIKKVFEKFRDKTLVTMSGFIFGSLIFLWPLTKNNEQTRIIENLISPSLSVQNIKYLFIIILGLITVLFLNRTNKKNV
ncbi:MAG: hypothetical protein CBC73_01945 [Flavobacteriales bacterium TMED113]|nr:MAG: hypothetical protein CBC73_01945 [Flavobacteriales bacterium TMED113]